MKLPCFGSHPHARRIHRHLGKMPDCLSRAAAFLEPRICERRRESALIEPLESRIAPASVFTFTDSDGDAYSVKVTGPGTATVTPFDPDADHGGRSIRSSSTAPSPEAR